MKMSLENSQLPQNKTPNSYQKDRKRNFERLRFIIEATSGLPSKEILNAWKSNALKGSIKEGGKEESYSDTDAREDFLKIVEKNLSCMTVIESKRPGICRFLYENYGIRNFGRFSAETWIAQYEEKERPGPYGLVISARDDWNASSYHDDALKAYEKFRATVQPTHSFRIIEAGSLPELAKLLLKLKRKQTQSPDFIVWSGHYGGNEFFLGPGRYRKQNYKFSIAKEDLNDIRSETYLDIFSRDTVMILDSCFKDEDNSLPYEVVGILGNTFITPSGNTSVKDFGVTVGQDGKLFFNVKYNFGVPTITTEGELIEKNNP